jgi:hypothetical protein
MEKTEQSLRLSGWTKVIDLLDKWIGCWVTEVNIVTL